MLPVTNSYWFRETHLSKFCFKIICEKRKQKILILNSSAKFIIFLANIRHVRFNKVNYFFLKHEYEKLSIWRVRFTPSTYYNQFPPSPNLRSGVPLFSRREGTPDTITWLFVCC